MRLARVIRKAERDWWGAEGESRRCSQEAFQAYAVCAEFAAWLRELAAECRRPGPAFNVSRALALEEAAAKLDPPKAGEEESKP
jgi:hypothetical protein